MSLHLTDITLTYPDGQNRLTALDRVSLHVPAGTLTAVVGPVRLGQIQPARRSGHLVLPIGSAGS